MSPAVPTLSPLSGAPPSLPIDLSPLLAWPGRALGALLAGAAAVLLVSAVRETGRRLPELIGAATAGTALEPLVGVLLDVPARLSELRWQLADAIVAARSALLRPRG